MLSVLIPTYNYDCRQLVKDLCRQGEALDEPFEIIVADDASTDVAARSDLRVLAGEAHVRLVENALNVGRARIRNQLADLAQGDWLLFVDCDASVPADFSLRTYLDATRQADVVCGGLRHPNVNPNPAATLRYRYERRADRRRAARYRNMSPYMDLTTFSLLVRRDVFLQIRFDDVCTDYGYEDVLFGVALQERGVSILHIDNPLVHMGLESNDVFLAKSETAMRTLHQLDGRTKGAARIDNAARRLHRLHLDGLCRWLFRLGRTALRRNLLSRHPSLFCFSCYKLGYYLSLR